MMKRLFVIFLMLFCSTGSFAGYDAEKEVFVYPDVLEYIVNDWDYFSTDIAEEQMDTFIDVFSNSLSDAGTFTLSNFRSAAAAAKIEGDDLTQLLDILLTVFHDSCKLNSDYDKCMKGFEPFAVRLPEGVALAKDYIKHNYKIDVVCSAEPRKEGGLHYLRCSSLDNKYWFELPFAALNEVKDNSILHGVLGAVGKIHNADLLTGISAVSAIAKDGDDGFAAYNVSDAAKCSQINETLNKLGYQSKVVKNSKAKQRYVDNINARYGPNNFVLKSYGVVLPDNVSNDLCEVSGIVRKTNELRTWNDIDNWVFYKQELNIYYALDEQLKQYVKLTLDSKHIPLESFQCNASTSFIQNGKQRDEVLTCYVNGHAVDFVFGDLSESSKKANNSAQQFISCTVNGGMFSGEGCEFLNEEGCNRLIKANNSTCETCSDIMWDPAKQLCILPDAEKFAKYEKNMAYVYMVGGAITAITVTALSAGTGAGAVLGVIAGSTEVLGAAIEIVAQVKLDEIPKKFLEVARKCNNQSCAIQAINDNLRTLSNIIGDISNEQLEAIDQMFEHLFDKIDENTEEGANFWIKFLENYKLPNEGGSLLEANQKRIFDKDAWEPEQVWRAIGVALQVVPTATSVTTKFLGRSPKLTKALSKITSKLDDLYKNSKFLQRLSAFRHTDTGYMVKVAAELLDDNIKAGDVTSSVITGQVGLITVHDGADIVKKVF